VVRHIIDAPADSGAASRSQAATVQRVKVDEGGAGQRLDNFLLRLLKGVPKTHVYRVIRSGEVRVNRGRASADTRLASGDEVRVPPVRLAVRAPPAPAREFPVLYEDEWLIALDKPAAVAVHGGSGVSFGVIEQLRRARPQLRFLELVHRLDKQTSGVLLLAKKRSALTALQAQFRARTTAKVYAALVVGAWPASRKVIDVALHKFEAADGKRRVRAVDADDEAGRRSISLVEVVQHFPTAPRRRQVTAAPQGGLSSPAEPDLPRGYTLLDVTIKTGRTHQIRVHLAHEGHPIVGDDQYGDFELNRQFARGVGLDGVRFARMFLHARRLAFDHPASGERIEVESTLPAECTRLLGMLCEPH